MTREENKTESEPNEDYNKKYTVVNREIEYLKKLESIKNDIAEA